MFVLMSTFVFKTLYLGQEFMLSICEILRSNKMPELVFFAMLHTFAMYYKFERENIYGGFNQLQVVKKKKKKNSPNVKTLGEKKDQS